MIEIKHRDTGEVLHTINADMLRGADLQGVALQGANLRNVGMYGADLRGAKITAEQIADVVAGIGVEVMP